MTTGSKCSRNKFKLRESDSCRNDSAENTYALGKKLYKAKPIAIYCFWAGIFDLQCSTCHSGLTIQPH